MANNGWIGVDLDGTLATYEQTPEHLWDPFKIGEPIVAMVCRIRAWLAQGVEVRIVTARVAHDGGSKTLKEELISCIQDWLFLQGLPRLKVQAHKDYQMVELWDDRAVRVNKNTGVISNQLEVRARDSNHQVQA